MQQIVDLQDDPSFRQLDVALLSIALDTPAELAVAAAEYGTQIPLLSDEEGMVSAAYGVMKWAVATGEPGHTFVLVDKDGTVAWIRDYGAPQNGGVMYVPVEQLVAQVSAHLGDG
jgi:peroxiredoxin